MRIFNPAELKNLYKAPINSTKGDNGQVTIIGGSKLFHGAPMFALTTASRIVDMVFFTSPEPSMGEVANNIKSSLFSFIWIPWEDLNKYIEKSDAVLIGPGMMRFASESQMPNDKYPMSNLDTVGQETREITKWFLNKFQHKKWVIDAGSLQVLDPGWIPKGSIVTPNQKEYERIFSIRARERESIRVEEVQENAKKYNCTIVLKGPKTIIASPTDVVMVEGGNPGLTKGGSGDVEAGLTVSLFAKNNALLSATAASFIVKKSAEELAENVGYNYNSDDLAKKVPEVLFEYTK